MKPIITNYYKEGVSIENIRLKDKITILFQNDGITRDPLEGKIQQSFHLEEIIGFLTIDKILFVVVVVEKREVCLVDEKKIYQAETIDMYPIYLYDQWKSLSSYLKEELTKLKTMFNDFELYYS